MNIFIGGVALLLLLGVVVSLDSHESQATGGLPIGGDGTSALSLNYILGLSAPTASSITNQYSPNLNFLNINPTLPTTQTNFVTPTQMPATVFPPAASAFNCMSLTTAADCQNDSRCRPYTTGDEIGDCVSMSGYQYEYLCNSFATNTSCNGTHFTYPFNFYNCTWNSTPMFLGCVPK